MRIARLDLTRYGRFTDFSIDFGEADPGRPEFHIIYGPNEAGKSTSLAAYLDLLFGIEHNSRYNFLHPYETMQLGGYLEFPSGKREVVRVKRLRNSLLDPQGNPLTETAALGEIGAIDRSAYLTMFSLDEDSLKEGGESILASKGELGELLFSATAGLAGISHSLQQLRDNAERIYKFRGRTTKMAELRKKLAESKQERERVDTLAHQFSQLVKARDEARMHYEEARATRAETQMRLERVKAMIRALPKFAELDQIEERLRPLETLREAPDHWVDQLPRLKDELVRLETRRESVEAQLTAFAREAGSIDLDESALACAEVMEAMETLRIRFMAAQEDLPDHRRRLAGVEQEIGFLARRLLMIEPAAATKPDEISARVPDVATEANIRRLMESHYGIVAALEGANHSAEEAENHLAELRRRLPVRDDGDENALRNAAAHADLVELLATWRSNGLETDRRLASKMHAERRVELAGRMAALLPWQGSGEALQKLVLPVMDPEGWEAEIAEIDREAASLEERQAERQARISEHRAELDALRGRQEIISGSEAAELRICRDAAWVRHRQELDEQSADAFEELMRKDDRATEARLAGSALLERTTQLTEMLDKLESSRRELDARRSRLQMRRDQVTAHIDAALTAISPEFQQGAGIGTLKDWLTARKEALLAVQTTQEAEAQVELAEHEMQRLKDRFIAAISKLGEDFTVEELQHAELSRLAVIAQTVIERLDTRHREAEAAAEAQRRVEAQHRSLAKARQAWTAWQDAWRELLAATWMGKIAPLPDVVAMRDLLTALDELKPLLRDWTQLAERIHRMEQDREQFSRKLASLASRMGVEQLPDLAELHRRCRGRVEHAQEAAARCEELRQRQEKQADELKLIGEELLLAGKLASAMQAHFSAATLDEVAEKLRGLKEKSTLLDRQDHLAQEVLELMDATDLEAARLQREKLDKDALLAEEGELEIRLELLDQELRERYAASSKASEEVEKVGADAAAARLELQCRTLQLEIEDNARRFMRLYAGISAAERALATYRDRHRSSLMQQASEAFRMISRGAYSGLSTQPEKDREVLIAQAADGRTRTADALSRGTRFQLYLALRVAGYLELARSRRPVPFIADDIMETFDDLRSAETFRVFERMAQAGQVIYLTHHHHLVEMARKICPDVRVHELPDPLTAGAA